MVPLGELGGVSIPFHLGHDLGLDGYKKSAGLTKKSFGLIVAVLLEMRSGLGKQSLCNREGFQVSSYVKHSC